MTPEQKKGIADLKLRLRAAEAAEKEAQAERDKKEGERDKLEDKTDAIELKADQRKAKLGAANKNLKATRKGIADKKQLTARLSDFELPDFEQLASPKVFGGQISFCANHLGLDSPYRVSGPADGSAPLTFEPI